MTCSNMLSADHVLINVKSNPMCVNFQLNRKTGEIYIHSFGVDESGNAGPVEHSGVVCCGDILVMINGEDIRRKDFTSCIALLRTELWPKQLVFQTKRQKQYIDPTIPATISSPKEIRVALQRTNSFLIEHLGEDKAISTLGNLQNILNTTGTIQAGSLRSLIQYAELLLSKGTEAIEKSSFEDVCSALSTLYRILESKEAQKKNEYQIQDASQQTKIRALERQKQLLEKKARDEFIQLCEHTYSHTMEGEWKNFKSLVELIKSTNSELKAQKLQALYPVSLGYRIRFGSGSNYCGAEHLWIEQLNGCISLHADKRKPQFILQLRGVKEEQEERKNNVDDKTGASLLIKIVNCKIVSEGIGEFLYDDIVIKAEIMADIPLEYNGREWFSMKPSQITFLKLETLCNDQLNRKLQFVMKYIVRAVINKISDFLLSSEIILSSFQSSNAANLSIDIQVKGYSLDVIDSKLPTNLNSTTSEACKILNISVEESYILTSIQKEISKSYPLEDLSISSLLRSYLLFRELPDYWHIYQAYWQRSIDLYCLKTLCSSFSIQKLLQKLEQLSQHTVEFDLIIHTFQLDADINECFGNGFKQSAIRTSNLYQVEKIKKITSLPTISMQENLAYQQKIYRSITEKLLAAQKQFKAIYLDLGGQYTNSLQLYAKKIRLSCQPNVKKYFKKSLKKSFTKSKIRTKTRIEEYPNEYIISLCEKNSTGIDELEVANVSITDMHTDVVVDVQKFVEKAKESQQDHISIFKTTFKPNNGKGNEFELSVDSTECMTFNVNASRATASVKFAPTIQLLEKNGTISQKTCDIFDSIVEKIQSSCVGNPKVELHFSVSVDNKNLCVYNHSKPFLHINTHINLLDFFAKG